METSEAHKKLEVVRIKKILVQNLLIYIGLHYVRRSLWIGTIRSTLIYNLGLLQAMIFFSTYEIIETCQMFCVFCRCTIILLESNLNSTVKVLALAKSERKRDKQKVFYAFLMKVIAATSVFQFSTTHTDFSPDDLHTFICLVQKVLILFIVLLKRTYV